MACSKSARFADVSSLSCGRADFRLSPPRVVPRAASAREEHGIAMITGIFGLPRAGKSTFLSYCVERALSGKPITAGRGSWKVNLTEHVHYDSVYSNFPIYGAQKFDFDDLGKRMFENCLILIDEISLFADSRNWKEFGEHLKMFFAMHGHYGVDVIYCSQSMDCDKKIRDRTQQYCFVVKSALFSGSSFVVPLIKHMDTVNGIPQDWYEKAPPLSCTRLRRSRYYWRFDSFCRDELPPVPVEFWEFPPSVAPPLSLRARCAAAVRRAWASARRLLTVRPRRTKRKTVFGENGKNREKAP